MRHTKLLLLLCLLSLGSFAASRAQTSPCKASFPPESGKPLGWQGGDAAYSVPLPDGRIVWIFGDTLYGPKRIVRNNFAQMVRNSLGISTCKDGKWHIDYIIRHDRAGKPLTYFVPSDLRHWYWALDGFYANGNLWVTLLCLRPSSVPVPDGLNFESCGADLAQISGLNKDPQHWSVTIHPLVPDGVKAYPSATTVVHGEYVYLFAVYESGTHPLVATRISLAKLNNPAANLEYFAADNTWKPGFVPAKAKEVMAKGAPELSIRYHPDRKQWFAVMVDPTFFSDKIILRTAPNLTGPWSEGKVIYTVPEMQHGPKYDKDIFCYAGKEHPELESTSNLVFTYVCNTLSVPGLITHPEIYIPQVIEQPIPATLPHAPGADSKN